MSWLPTIINTAIFVWLMVMAFAWMARTLYSDRQRLGKNRLLVRVIRTLRHSRDYAAMMAVEEIKEQLLDEADRLERELRDERHWRCRLGLTPAYARDCHPLQRLWRAYRDKTPAKTPAPEDGEKTDVGR